MAELEASSSVLSHGSWSASHSALVRQQERLRQRVAPIVAGAWVVTQSLVLVLIPVGESGLVLPSVQAQ